ncbi:PKD domain-containing protein [Hymenobacter properus]|uniref:PKD domain-containing protein n=1 Tax=Hymenobacter properus TaxID=2791026 RepID=A0A931FMR6_9BACT|nr:PKD domain-containing protein [Hymenobacter properus]MBF9141929.1 PKD domain-containing protein [Hymenobacter properus]MBR7720737.1 PKD domain-containing protein [Microvirga sp. SRT04]
MTFCKKHLSVLLAAAAALSLSSCDSKKDADTPAPTPKPTAAFTYTGGACQTGCPVTFQNTSKNATTYTWNFGDNTTGTQADAQVTHSFAQPGFYRVKLTAQSAAGTDTTSQRVSVGCGGVVPVTASISTATTWTACNVYYLNSGIMVSNTLTIEPGTVVKFGPNAALALTGNGRFVAKGTAAAPIYFTSYHDDAHGGDSNANGAATGPARKDWRYMDLNATTGSQFAYCQFMYGGNGGNTLFCDGGAASITNCTFAHNGDDVSVITTAALNAHSAQAGTVIQNNTFFDNVRPLSITSNIDLDDSNTFHNPANATEKNQYQGIVTEWNNNVSKPNVGWDETELAYVNISNIDIARGKTLRLGNNVTLKFTSGREVTLRDGPSQLLNATGPGVTFTSFKDDSRGGDSNGNGTLNSPVKGDWSGIYHDTLPGAWMGWANLYFATH